MSRSVSLSPSTPVPPHVGSPAAPRVRRFVLASAAALAFLYLAGVGAAYSWIHFVRGNDRISFADVAFLRVVQVRRAMAEQQFALGKAEVGKKNYRAAYLAFATAIRRDPENVPGRIEAAAFFSSIGSVKMEVSTLEDGLTRAPENLLLTDKTFDLLTSTGRDQTALDLMQKLYGERPSGENAPMVEIYRILATLNVGDDAGAQRLLEAHPELHHYTLAPAALADVLWKSKERLAAIEILSTCVASGRGDYALYAKLARWQELGGMPDDAIATAKQARSRFPDDIAARVLSIEALANQSPSSREVLADTESFLRDVGDRPGAIEALAELAGRKGWVDLERNLYLVAANRQPELRMLALYSADALAANSSFEEEQRILDQVEAQSEDSSQNFAVQLRRREVVSAAARSDHDAIRENARFLAAALQSSDPESLDSYRRLFARMGIKEAVAAFPNP